jgi:chromosome segregation ATPase
MKMELRNITAKKKEAQEELNTLVAEVDLLREEKHTLSQDIQSIKEGKDKIIQRQEEQLLSVTTKLKTEGKQLSKLEETIGELGIIKTELENIKRDIEKDVDYLNEVLVKTHVDTAQAVGRLKQILSEKEILEEEKHKTSTELKFLKSKIFVSTRKLKDIQAGIKLEQLKWDEIKREQKRHSDHAQYLNDKEGFLREQYKLLGVKYVVYNSR